MTRDSDGASVQANGTGRTVERRLHRRWLLGVAGGLGVVLATPYASMGVPRQILPGRLGHAAMDSGYTWLLDSPSALRPSDPGEPSEAEIDELLEYQADRSDASADVVARWGEGPVVFPWLDLGMRITAETFPPGLLENRAQVLLRVAMHDAIVAANDAQSAYARPAPAAADERITPISSGSADRSSFPSVHATVAGAAATVLAYLFPDASSDEFAGMAEEAAMSRLWAGTNYRSDVTAGLELGRAVGELAVARGRADGSDAVWDGNGWPSGDGYYVPTPPNFVDPPFGVVAGTWATWVLPSGDAIRPAPFPEFGSSGWQAEVATVRHATEKRTPAQERTIDNWLSAGPSGFYTDYARHLIERERLSEAEAANVLAMISVAIYDTLVAVWDGKYHYWVARPLSVDSDLDLYIPNPPYPSYPAGFPSACSAGATVLSLIFPDAATDLMTSALEGATQRCWSGIHYMLDNEVGLVMGGRVARMVVNAVQSADAATDA